MATFKTRARTLDMLGRQQIAGIPTAISELFKNAHDAYASRVEIDYYRSDGLFVLRDAVFFREPANETLLDVKRRPSGLGVGSCGGMHGHRRDTIHLVAHAPHMDGGQMLDPLLDLKG